MDEYTKHLPLPVSDLWSIALLAALIVIVVHLAEVTLCEGMNPWCKKAFSFINVFFGIVATQLQKGLFGKFETVDPVWLTAVAAVISWDLWLHRERLARLLATFTGQGFGCVEGKAGIGAACVDPKGGPASEQRHSWSLPADQIPPPPIESERKP